MQAAPHSLWLARWSVCLAVALPGAARAADLELGPRIQLYADTDQTVVVSTRTRFSAELKSGTKIEASVSEDVVSSASVDVRSAATPHLQEARGEVGVGVSQKLGTQALSAGSVFAAERDYLSIGAWAGARSELFQGNSAFAARGAYTHNIIRRADDPAFERWSSDASADASWTQLLSTLTAAQLSFTWARQAGFLASPYRMVPVGDGQRSVPEVSPPQRDRFAVAVALKQWLGIGALHLEYRYYSDTFSIGSHTPEVHFTTELGAVSLRARYRYYVQTGAFFYRSTYEAPSQWLSRDRELSPFSSHLFGVKAQWTPTRPFHRTQVRLDLKVEGLYFDYRDFPALPSRWVLSAQAGAELEF